MARSLSVQPFHGPRNRPITHWLDSIVVMCRKLLSEMIYCELRTLNNQHEN